MIGHERASVAIIIGDVAGSGAVISRQFRVDWVERFYNAADLDPYCDPTWLAVASGYSVRPLLPGERAPALLDLSTVYYGWTPDQRVTGGRAFRGLALRALAKVPHNDLDVHLFAAELAAPERAVRAVPVGEVLRRQRWAPTWWIEARIAGLRASGTRRRTLVNATQ